MDKFVAHNCHDFYMSVNYKADSIKNYFDFITKGREEGSAELHFVFLLCLSLF